jgi:hypothetical protein
MRRQREADQFVSIRQKIDEGVRMDARTNRKTEVVSRAASTMRAARDEAPENESKLWRRGNTEQGNHSRRLSARFHHDTTMKSGRYAQARFGGGEGRLGLFSRTIRVPLLVRPRAGLGKDQSMIDQAQ